MENKKPENIADFSAEDSETSDYLQGDSPAEELNFNGLFSNQFNNIVPFYQSPKGPTSLYTATRFGKRYMLKCLKEQYRTDPMYNLWLAKEFEIGISLDHPCIRRTLNLETVPGLGKTIVLEYVDGHSLKDLIASGEVSVSAARLIARQIADAFEYIHAKQVYHQDLKPANVLVSCQGNAVKVIDFNYSDSNEFVVLKNPAGSKKYMAPEQFEAGAHPSALADIYSLGVIMSELAAAADDDDLAEIAERCMDSRPEKRPQSVSMIKLPGLQSPARQAILSFLSSKSLTYVLLSLCLGLTAAIAFKLFQSF